MQCTFPTSVNSLEGNPVISKLDSVITIHNFARDFDSDKVTDNGNGIYTKITTKLSFTITNTKQGVEVSEESVAEKGSLTIKKIVKSSEGNILKENGLYYNIICRIG